LPAKARVTIADRNVQAGEALEPSLGNYGRPRMTEVSVVREFGTIGCLI
jgi:hypothetical protein